MASCYIVTCHGQCLFKGESDLHKITVDELGIIESALTLNSFFSPHGLVHQNELATCAFKKALNSAMTAFLCRYRSATSFRLIIDTATGHLLITVPKLRIIGCHINLLTGLQPDFPLKVSVAIVTAARCREPRQESFVI